jgi:hypothetical protein
MQFGRTNVNKFLIEEQRRNPALAGDFSMLISDVVRSCKAISQVISRGALAARRRPLVTEPARRRASSPAEMANQAFLNHCVWGGHLTALTSSEAADIYSDSERRRARQVPAGFRPARRRRTSTSMSPSAASSPYSPAATTSANRRRPIFCNRDRASWPPVTRCTVRRRCWC